MKELSVLIPTYNDDCTHLVSTLQQQAEKLGTAYEIIVADDGSSDQETVRRNRSINDVPHCRLIERHENAGRAAIRNFLAQQARYPFLVFIDADMVVPHDDYLRRYASHPCETVIDGGIMVREGNGPQHTLRYQYEKSAEGSHLVSDRRKHPYLHFHTANFLVARTVMLEHPFDERFRRYGFEDVFFGKQLKEHQVVVEHIDNPLSFEIFEDNASFLNKTEEGLRTLHQFQQELLGYSGLLHVVSRLRHFGLLPLVRCWHRLFGGCERNRLQKGHYSPILFQLYRLGYFLGL